LTLSIVQSAQFAPLAAVGSGTVTLPGAPTAGNLLLLFSFSNANAADSAMLRPQWTAGNSIANGGEWEPVTTEPNFGNAGTSVWMRYAASGESASVTCNASIGANECGLALYEVASDSGVPVIAAAESSHESSTATTHDWPTIDAEAGICFASGWLSTSGGGSNWLNGWTDSFAQHRLFENSRAVIATRTLGSPATVAPDNTSAAAKLSSECIVSVTESDVRRPHALQYGFGYVAGNDPTVPLTRTPTPGNILLMVGTGRLDFGSPPAGFGLVASAVAPDGFARLAAWQKVAGAGEATSYLLDTTTSEFHMCWVLEIEQSDLFAPSVIAVTNETAAAGGTTMVSGTLPDADGLALWFIQQSSDGGLGTLSNDWNNSFDSKTLQVNGTTALPSGVCIGRQLTAPVTSLSCTGNRSAARSSAGILLTLGLAGLSPQSTLLSFRR
jgi:hypothetical protein